MFPIIEIKKDVFRINRLEEYGGEIIYENVKSLIDDFKEKKLFPGDLKLGVIEWITKFLEPLRDQFNNTSMSNILERAY